LAAIVAADYVEVPTDLPEEPVTPDQLEELTKSLEKQMREAAKQFEFEKAAQIRDRIKVLKEKATATLMGVEQSTSQEVEAPGGHESSGQQT
jgi:excinuclease UvrABC helicase subunit UvrB